jgi:hypothetical protein
VLTHPAEWRKEAADQAGAERLAILAANLGDTEAVHQLAGRRMDTTDDSAERLRRYGLTHEGAISEPWD